MKNHKNFRSHPEVNFLNIYRRAKRSKPKMYGEMKRAVTVQDLLFANRNKTADRTSQHCHARRTFPYFRVRAVLLDMTSSCWRLEGRKCLRLLQCLRALRTSETSESTPQSQRTAYPTLAASHNHNQSRKTDRMATS
jgi:hypothetical protein